MPVDGEGLVRAAVDPQIVSWMTSSTSLSPRGRLTATAILSDPDGVGDIAGGVLEDVAGRGYGTFGVDGSPGTLSIQLTWEVVTSVESVEVETTRSMVARFFDGAGNAVEQRFDISLGCDDGLGYCTNRCVDFDSRDDCGACGNRCSPNFTCAERQCTGTVVRDDGDPDNGSDYSCYQLCAREGLRCIVDPVEGAGVAEYFFCSAELVELRTCDDVAPASRACGGGPEESRSYLRCNCAEL